MFPQHQLLCNQTFVSSFIPNVFVQIILLSLVPTRSFIYETCVFHRISSQIAMDCSTSSLTKQCSIVIQKHFWNNIVITTKISRIKFLHDQSSGSLADFFLLNQQCILISAFPNCPAGFNNWIALLFLSIKAFWYISQNTDWFPCNCLTPASKHCFASSYSSHNKFYGV